jgi:hypothetical protein
MTDPKTMTTDALLKWAQVKLEHVHHDDDFDTVKLARELAFRLEAVEGMALHPRK